MIELSFETTKLPGVLLIKPAVFGDERGFFKESFRADSYHDVGIVDPFVQDNHSRSARGVLRGLHLQKTQPQGKLVSCGQGAIYDVAVDVDPRSATFGQYVGFELNDTNHYQLWVPAGYAHGFCTLSETADLHYKCTDYYAPWDEGGLLWNDPEVAIDWPVKNPTLSRKDQLLPSLEQLRQQSSKTQQVG